MQESFSLQNEISKLKTRNLTLQTEKTELRTEMTELKAKNDFMEDEADQNRMKFRE